MSNNDINIHDISGQVAFAQVGGNLTGDIIAGNKTIIQNIIQQVAKQIVTAPYKFLASYDISDRDIFFGREAVIEDLVGKLPRYKTLVINGRSGSGKTSLINAGLIPRLAENGYQYLSFRDYHDPLRQFSEHIRQNPAFQAYADAAHSLPVFLHALISQQHAPVVVIFDQFERFFLNVPTATRQQFIQEIKACVESALTGKEIAVIFAEREEYFGQFTREFNAVIPAFLKETEIIDLPLLGRAEAHAAILRPLEKIAAKIGYDPEFVETVLLPGLMGESSGGVTIDPPHLQIVCNQLYEQAKTRYAAKLERGGVVEIDRALYDELHGATGILQSYLDDRLAKIVPQLPDGQAVLRAMLKTMVATTTGTRTFVALPDVQRRLSDVTPETVVDGLRLLREERIIEIRGQDEATTYSLSHEVMVAKVQSWFDERELQHQKAKETLERGLAEWVSSQALLNENQVKQIRQWAQPEDLTTQAEELLTKSQHAYEEQQRKEAEQERRIRRNRNAFQMALGIGFVIAVILSALAFWQQKIAVKEKQRAEDQTVIAQANSEEAKKQQTEAEKRRQEAEKEKAKAERQSMISLAQVLSFQAIDQQGYYKDTLAALLARQAYLLNEEAQATSGWVQIDKALRFAVDALCFKAVVLPHAQQVGGVAFSPDGATLASGSWDGTIRLWDVATGVERAVLRGHPWTVISVVFSPDGRLLASGSADQTVRLWNVANGKQQAVLRGHQGPIHSVAFSPDGQTLASGSQDQTIRLWDVANGQEQAVLQGHTKVVYSVAFSPDGMTLASGGDQTVRLWDVASKQERKMLWGHEKGVHPVAFSPDGQTLASGSEDQTIRLWNVASGEQQAVLQGHKSFVDALAFSRDGQTLASGSWDNTVRLWDVATAQERKILRGHMKLVFSVAFSPDGKTVASGSWDHTVRLWDVTSDQEHKILRGHKAAVDTVTFSPDGHTLASGSSDNTIRLWDVTSGVEHVIPQDQRTWSVAFSPDSRMLASGNEDQTIRLWDVINQKEQAVLRGHEGAVHSVAFSRDGQTLASASWDTTIRLWNVANGQERTVLRGHEDVVTSVAFSTDGQTLASTSRDETIRLWDVASGKQQAVLRGHTTSHTSTVDIFSVAFSPDGKTLAWGGSQDKSIWLWDVASQQERVELRGHDLMVRSLAFSPDGKTLASGSEDHTVRLWDVTTGTERAILRGHEMGVAAVAFSSDGQILASASGDRTVRLWTWPTKTLAKNVCQKVWRNLTWDEWQQFVGQDIPYARTCPNLLVDPSVLEAARNLAETGDINTAKTIFQHVRELDPTLNISAESWNTLCWFGSLHGAAAEVQDACEQAMNGASAAEQAGIRDSRGLARALTGNIAGAIEDFQAYVDGTDDEVAKAQRQQWIEALQKGENPFTPEVLKGLR